MIQQRMQELRLEYARGQAQMKVLERQERELSETLLRISGAIQVLEELLADEKAGANGKTPQEAA